MQSVPYSPSLLLTHNLGTSVQHKDRFPALLLRITTCSSYRASVLYLTFMCLQVLWISWHAYLLRETNERVASRSFHVQDFPRQLLSCRWHLLRLWTTVIKLAHQNLSVGFGKLDKPFLGVFNNSVIDSRLQRFKGTIFTCRCFWGDTEPVSISYKTWKQNRH